MKNYYLRYFIGLVIAIGLIIALIFLLTQSGNKTKAPTPRSLSSFSNTTAVARLTITGPITAPQNHNSIVITVGRDQAVYQHFTGYDGTVVDSKTFDNTENSYNSFLHAIGRAGFTLGNAKPSLADSTGYCPLGQVYTFELIEDGNQLENLWTSSCGGTKTFGGNLSVNLELFQAQIPDYTALTNNIAM